MKSENRKKMSVMQKVSASAAVFCIGIPMVFTGVNAYHNQEVNENASKTQAEVSELLNGNATKTVSVPLDKNYDIKGSSVTSKKPEPKLDEAKYIKAKTDTVKIDPKKSKGVEMSSKVAKGEKPNLAKETPKPSKVKPKQYYGKIENPLWGTANLAEGKAFDTATYKKLLDEGAVVHYASREQPGEIGNFFVSGHRTTSGGKFSENGGIFKNATELKKGNSVKVTTMDGVFEYKVIKEAYRVQPSEVSVSSDPFSKYVNDTRKLMTIQTCGEWGTDHRELIILEMVEK